MPPINGLDFVFFFELLNFSWVGADLRKVSFWRCLGLFCLGDLEGEGGKGKGGGVDYVRWVYCG